MFKYNENVLFIVDFKICTLTNNKPRVAFVDQHKSNEMIVSKVKQENKTSPTNTPPLPDLCSPKKPLFFPVRQHRKNKKEKTITQKNT